MSTGGRWVVAIVSGLIAVISVLTFFGVITWADSFVCALAGQAALGPMCIAPPALAGIAYVAALVALTAWPRAPKASGSS